jgi:uncharacterized membrane protein YoaK (UPF0700 family)
MTHEQIITTISSIPMVFALVAIIRKSAPKINGMVLTVVLAGLLAGVAQVLGFYAASVPPVVWAVLGGMAGAILPVGAVTVADRMVDRHAAGVLPQTRIQTIRPPVS